MVCLTLHEIYSELGLKRCLSGCRESDLELGCLWKETLALEAVFHEEWISRWEQSGVQDIGLACRF